jgi:NAD(P)-dependent dehydrogenase (short-subunit alcohol dehydrogenase family)
MAAYAKALSDTPIKVNAVCPGLTATDLSGNYGSRTPAEGAAAAIRFALVPDDGPTGVIHNDAGELPW